MKHIKLFENFSPNIELTDFRSFKPSDDIISIIDERLMELFDYMNQPVVRIFSNFPSVDPPDTFRVCIEDRSFIFIVSSEIIECIKALISNLKQYKIKIVEIHTTNFRLRESDIDELLNQEVEYISLKLTQL